MRIIYRVFGRLPYWLGLITVSVFLAYAVLPVYGLLILALTVMVGVYSEAEDHGSSVFIAGFVATLAAIGTNVFAIGLWALKTKSHLLDDVRAELTPLVDKILAMNTSAKIDVDSLIQQLPSGLVIGLIVGLAIALLGENRLRGWFGYAASLRHSNGQTTPRVDLGRVDLSVALGAASDSTPISKPVTNPVVNQMLIQYPALASFRVPDAFIWITTASIFGAFYRHGNEMIETISINAINVLAVIFFFQGLAIASHLFRAYKISAFWQGLWYFVLVLQLFFLVSLVGFADYWLDFRERLTRKPAETNKGF